jgi:flavin-dependent dehydrogenase
VGDAAGYFDPLTGQGIYRALRSAELAAQAIRQALDGQEELAWRAYRRRLAASAAPGVRRQRWLDHLVRRPRLLGAGLGLLALCPPAGRRLIALLGDCHLP